MGKHFGFDKAHDGVAKHLEVVVHPGNDVGDTSDRYFEPGNYDLILQYENNSGTFTSCGIVDNFTISEYNLQIDSVNVTDVVCRVAEGQLDIYMTADNNPLTYYIQNYSKNKFVIPY